ncbi:hypothetical protein [Gracilibacillus kekensis]|uniref:Uncharacterized protein n=1 Tax=Gracilibacillus kekensis TaxID=1027249 RepID=A0A1M7P663_9BACI|nr:hypothetical protein [Gracilibacillus kekensis]SHN11843.1 hypothetical protein SAMN05216179_2010 [Gracilibacillus kekensis]
MKLSNVFFIFTAIVTTIIVFRNSFINLLLKIPFVRKVGVRFSMKIPYIRNKLMGSMFK